jgi:hypothetical protein
MQRIQKPLCDRRSYQHAVLDNGLRVLAIQDKEAVFAAACANVQVRHQLLAQQLTAALPPNHDTHHTKHCDIPGSAAAVFIQTCHSEPREGDP